MPNTTTETAAPVTITLHYPLAGAYKGGRANLKAIRSHASIDGSAPLCGSLKYELCDMVETDEKAIADLCPRCAAKMAKLVAAGAVIAEERS